MNILISCVGKRGGYVAEFFRSQLGSTDRIVGTANTAWTPGFKACDAGFVLPDVQDADYLAAVLDLCERERVDAVVCVEDYDVRRLAVAREEFLCRGIVPLFPSHAVTELAADKQRMGDYLIAHDIASPRTALALEATSEFRYPLYVKPRFGNASSGVFLARDRRELEFFFDYAPDMIVREQAQGQEINIQLCGDLDGRTVGMCALKKRVMRRGETDQAETFRDGRVMEFGLRLGEILEATGPVDVDVMQSADALVVLDVNTRFGGGYPAAHLAGADFPRLLLEMVRSGAVTEPSFGARAGVVMMKGIEIMGGDSAAFFEQELRVRGD